MLSIFSYTCWSFVCLLWKTICSGPLPIFLIRLQLMLEQHGFEQCISTYTQIVFNKYSTYISSLNQLSVRKVYVQLEITICGIKRTRVWVLIRFKLFLLPALQWVIYQFLCLEAEIAACRFSTVLGVGIPNPCVVQRSTVFLFLFFFCYFATVGVPYIFWVLTLYKIYCLQLFSPIL